jgi:MYXO-CTERM domain-containing protein
MPVRRGICLIATAAVLLSAAPASAYDHKHTHRWITRQAARLLMEAYPGRYDELAAFVDRVADGAEHEDDLFLDGDDDPSTLRVMRHFYRPVDELGLTMNGQLFPSSYEWTVVGRPDNAWDWRDGIAAYAAGDKDEAYFVLGHVVHLVQDLTVPAHAHLDIHGPPAGDDYEAYCSSQMIDEHTSMLPLPPAGAAIPAFASAHQAWQRTAQASYWRNLYPGRFVGEQTADGVIAEMFPSVAWSWARQTWTIGTPAVGDLGEDFFEDEPGHYYFKNAEHPAAVDRAGLDVFAPQNVALAPNTAGASMTELMARDLIPVAVLHTAGVMKLYLDEAHQLEPEPEPEPEPTDSAAGCGVGGGSPSALLPVLVALLLFVVRRRRLGLGARFLVERQAAGGGVARECARKRGQRGAGAGGGVRPPHDPPRRAVGAAWPRRKRPGEARLFLARSSRCALSR